MEKKKTFEISEDAVVAIRKALGRMPHDDVNPIIVFLERNLVLKKDEDEAEVV